VVFSGGTDSTCVAALAAERHSAVHLLTYHELGTKHSPVPLGNVALLQKYFPDTPISHHAYSTDRLVRHIGYERYFRNLLKYGFYMLATPGFSSLSWHVRTIVYCRQNGITHVYDGLTRELLQFPGHMETVIEEFKKMYHAFGIRYENLVRDWEVPEDIQFLDRLIVDQHGYCLPSEEGERDLRRTTGRYLFEKGILPHPNVKGSPLDRKMQHDCYPFVLYNIMAFWLAMNVKDYTSFAQDMATLFRDKIGTLMPALREYVEKGTGPMARLVETR
jgi:hypothetical protein